MEVHIVMLGAVLSLVLLCPAQGLVGLECERSKEGTSRREKVIMQVKALRDRKIRRPTK